MSINVPLDINDGLCEFRPQGEHSLTEAVALVSAAISYCRDRGVPKLLVNATGLTGVPVPTLVDRFLMVEEWAQMASGTVVVAMVVLPEYIHPQKFGVRVALEFGLICNVHITEDEALRWLREGSPRHDP
jgi:hypothetical protein